MENQGLKFCSPGSVMTAEKPQLESVCYEGGDPDSARFAETGRRTDPRTHRDYGSQSL